jgi:1-acyl-sn-glycerol-3-phosphate acyltransferase
MTMKRNPFVYSVTRRIARLIFSMFYRIEEDRSEALPDHGPAVILPKHQYWTDIPIVSLAFEPLLYFLAKKELFEYPLIRHYLSLLGGIPVDRRESIRTLKSFRMVISLLKAGEKVVIFPEGTYFRDRVGLGKSRLLRMILKFQSEWEYRIPFIPVGIQYGERVGWRRRVAIRIGRPQFAERESEDTLLTERVMKEIGRLCELPLHQSPGFGARSMEL